MATKPKISNYYNPISNPAGGMKPIVVGPNSPLAGIRSKVEIGTGGFPIAKRAPVAPVSAAPLFGGASAGGGNPSAAPVGPAGATGAAPASQIPQQWLKADGTIKTPDEIASDIGGTLRNTATGPDVGRLAADQFSGVNKTPEQLATEARELSAIRNDIAVGAKDPYKVASRSGIAYTPEQLKAIEQAQAGIYDPALAGAMSKLESAQAAEAEASKWKQELDKLAVVHGYDLEKMQADQQFQYGLAQYKASLDAANAGGAAGGLTPYSDERSFRTVQSIDELMNQVNGWTTGWGSLLAGVPATDSKSFNTQLNTLKAAIAFGELTAMREASKTGGALGNVSNIELNLLESALAGLDSAQRPEDFKIQLQKAKDSINRWRAAAGAAPLGTGETPGASGGGAIPAGTDGASYGFYGYESDGTQWVLKE